MCRQALPPPRHADRALAWWVWSMMLHLGVEGLDDACLCARSPTCSSDLVAMVGEAGHN